MNQDEKSKLVPVGLDIGSLNARVAIQTLNLPSMIVPNEIGQRYTIALAAPEPTVEDDPLNDQYWDSNYNEGGKKKKADDRPNVHYLIGDSARKSLHRLKKPLAPHYILEMIQRLERYHGNDDDDGDSLDNNTDREQDKSDILAATTNFFQHLVNLATHAAHIPSQHLRFVIAVPHTFESTFSRHILSAVQSGCVQAIRDSGVKTHEKKTVFNENRILSMISHPMAIVHAHNLLSKPYTNVIVIDWGASALTLSRLDIQSGGLVSIQKHSSESKFSGQKIIHLLVQHIAELFERQSRGAIPPGETLMNKKARAKLEVAAEDALRSFGFSPKVTITIDGLIDGLDCHVDVMLARFEMLLGDILKGSELLLQMYADGGADAVLVAGNVVRMKCIEKMLDRVFPSDKFWKGEEVTTVPPEEAIALGCAAYANQCLTSDEFALLNQISNDSNTLHHHDEEVFLSPVGIGLSFQEGDPAALILIEKNTVLPILVTKMVDLTLCSSNELHIVQINDCDERLIGKIHGFLTPVPSAVEIIIELGLDGNLSVSVNGGPICQL